MRLSLGSFGFVLVTGAVLALGASGCIVVHDRPVVGTTTCVPPTFENQQIPYTGFNVSPGASTAISPGDAAYAVTASGAGTYRLTWTDTNGLSTCFSGLITGETAFTQSQVQGFSGHETLVFNRSNQIAFASIPGDNVDGVDFATDQDPVFFDVLANGTFAVNIYFTSTATGVVSTTGGVNPVSFTSP